MIALDNFKNMLIVASIVLAITVLIVVMALISKSSNRIDVSDRWRKINKIFSEGKAGQKQAVIEADKLLDYVLKQFRFRGNTMGERLKSARKQLGSENNAAWSAHKLRNRMVHETDFSPSKNDCLKALGNFKRSIKQLGARV